MKKGAMAIVLISILLIGFAAGFLTGRSFFAANITVTGVTSDQINVGKQTDSPQEAPSALKGFRINVNTASASLLETLPGIGEIAAQKIVDYRVYHGPFSSTEDLLNVEGIGPAILEQIREMITVEDSQ